MPSESMSVPAISGSGVVGKGKKKDMPGFWRGVSKKSSDGLPLCGSIGFGFLVEPEDLQTIWLRLGKNRKAMIDYLAEKKSWHMEGCYRPAGKHIATQIVDMFLFFQDNSQSLFFIKEGCSCRWLVRKTSGYFFHNGPDPKFGTLEAWLPHRVSFELVREATKEERKPQLGRGISTLMSGGMTLEL